MSAHEIVMGLSAPEAAHAASKDDLGILPEWNLADLYPGMEAPEFKRDLAHVDEESKAFAATYQGKLSTLLSGQKASVALHEAIARYERLDEVMGRLMSYVGLVYAGDTSDPARAKLYGDTQERITSAGTHLLFFRSSSTTSTTKRWRRPWPTGAARPLPALARRHQARKAPSARGQARASLPREVGDGAAAWNRLFDETMAALRFEVDGEELTLEPTLNMLQDTDAGVRKRAAEALAKVFKENLRIFSLITNTLAKDKDISDRWRGFKDVADARHLSNRVEPEVVEALVAAVRAAYPRLSHRYYRAEGTWFGKDALDFWDRNAPLPKVEQPHHPLGGCASTPCFRPMRASRRKWRRSPSASSRMAGSMRRCVPERRLAPSRIRRCRQSHPYLLLNYQGKPRDVMTLAHELGHGVHQVLAAPQRRADGADAIDAR